MNEWLQIVRDEYSLAITVVVVALSVAFNIFIIIFLRRNDDKHEKQHKYIDDFMKRAHQSYIDKKKKETASSRQ